MDECPCTWRIAGEPGQGDAVGAALSRGQATLWYGPRCFAYSCGRDESGNYRLQLQAVGHLLPAGIDAPVLVLSDDGASAQQLIAPDGEGEVVQLLGRALFADAARTADLEEQWP